MAAPMRGFHPLTAAWFGGRFDGATEPQREAWPRIRAGRDVLISAPTGSGKTLAALLICLDGLVARAAGGDGLEDRTEVVYVSPLKALSTDVHRNLDAPLSGITAIAEAEGAALAPIRTAVRTGDTPVWEREKLARRPPHVLVTTPESLFILLTAERGRRALRDARVIVVDEIHAVADDKRGAHLALTLARLDDLVRKAGGVRPQRIGLSATVNPIEAIAGLLRGGAESAPEIVNAGHRRALDLAVEVPGEALGVVATNETWGEIHDRIARLASEHRTTLVFVNTRRLAERIAHHLAERLGDDAVLAHHGSLSRQLRRKAETELKAGRLRAVVATASLELGIDVGSVDLVCQIGSPRSIAVALQRVGRSGHKVDRRCMPKGRFFPTTRDELIETAALVRAIRRGLLDELTVPDWPRDVLAQQIVAATACEPWPEDDLFDLVRSAYPYRDLPRGEFDAVVTMLSDGIATGRGRYGAYVHRDRVNRMLRGRRGGRLAAVTSGGAIPDNANYLVVAEPEGTTVGTVDEDFAVESLSGDVFLLGTTSWRIRRIEAGRVRVEDAHGAAPSIPFWRGEAPGRTRELSDEVSALRARIAEAAGGAGARNADGGNSSGSGDSADSGNGAAAALLESECGLDASGAEQAAAYVRAGVAALGALPSRRTVVAERFFDEGGGMQLVIHAPFGARINRAWGLALRKRFCRSFNFELQAAATDNGIVISLAEQHSFPLDAVFRFLRAESVEEVLTQAMLPAPMFTARWRWNASRALAVLRFAGGRKVPPPLQRMRSDDLLASVFPDQAACPENLTGDIRPPRHPLVDETVRDCLHEAMDLDGLRAVLAAIERGEMETRAVETAEPSVFSHEILNANPYAFLDDAPLEERRARAVQLRRTLPESARDVGALDAAAITEVAAESWPVVRDADELHDALLTLTVVPPAAEWRAWYAELERSRRAATLVAGGRTLWTPAERRRVAEALHPDGRFSQETPDVPQEAPESREAAAVEVVRGWLESSGPRRARDLAETLAAPRAVIDGALARLEGEGQVLRGRFSPDGAPPGGASGDDGDAIEWCNRRVLARIHRLTLGRLRREIAPVTAADFVRFLARWQHVAPGARLHGAAGLLQVLRQLQGYETSAAAWESDVLARRVADYDPEMLDLLCLSGETTWGRLSPHPAFGAAAPDADAAGPASSTPALRPRSRRRVRPTRVAPLTFFLREDAAWLAPPAGACAADRAALSHAGRAVLEQLEVRGASFLRDLVRATGRLASEVEEGLWELAAGGLVTADGFDNLRALIDPKRRRGEGRFRAARPRHAAGRWALLRPEAAGAAETTAAATARGEAFARQLLARWGVVFRDLIVREALAPPWRELLQALRRLEARGEVRGGRFVDGFLGEQFARPEAVESLRSVRRDPARPASGERLRVSAADPLNLVGIVVPGARVGALSGEAVDVLGPLYIDVQ